MLNNPLGTYNITLVKKIDYSKRNKILDSSVVNISSNEITCKIKNVAITSVLDTSSPIYNKVKRLTGIVMLSTDYANVDLEDVIILKNKKYIIQSVLPIFEENKILTKFKHFQIEARG